MVTVAGFKCESKMFSTVSRKIRTHCKFIMAPFLMQFQFILVLSYVYLLQMNIIISSSHGHIVEPRIVNGIPTTASRFPFIAAIGVMSRGFYPICGGSILRKEYPAIILTAAHCLSRYHKQYEYRVELYDNDVRVDGNDDPGNYTQWKVLCTIWHKSFNITTYDNDIGLLFLDADLSLPKYKNYGEIIIPDNITHWNDSCCYDHELLTIIGYGRSEHGDNAAFTETLEYAHVEYMNKTICNIELTEWYIDNYNVSTNFTVNNTNYWEFALDSQICAIGDNDDACQGDSGGPLMRNGSNIQIGIISTGFGCNEGIPAIYTNLGLFNDWINHTIDSFQPLCLETDPPTSTTSNPSSNPTISPITSAPTYVTDSPTPFLSIFTDMSSTEDFAEEAKEQNLQLAIGTSVAGFIFCVCFIFWYVRNMKKKKLLRYNRMDIDDQTSTVNRKNATKSKRNKNKKNKDKEGMNGALNATSTEIEMNQTNIMTDDIR